MLLIERSRCRPIAARSRGKRLAKQQNCASTEGQLAIAGDSAAKSAPVKQRRRRTMEFFCGLDVAMDETAVCVVDDHGVVHLEITAVTDPDAAVCGAEAISAAPAACRYEAGALSPWLHPELKNSACRPSAWRRSTCAPRCRRSVTRPTRPMRWASPTSCAPAGPGRPISSRKAATGRSFC